jgi:hypothetical protein
MQSHSYGTLKSIMKSAILTGAGILLLSITTGFIISQATHTMVVKIHAKDLPQHGLIIVKGSDSDFDAIAKKLLKNVTVEELENIRVVAVAVRNTGTKRVVAHTIIWECAEADGKKRAYRISYANSEFFTDGGDFSNGVNDTNLDETIEPGGERLVSLAPLPHEGPGGGGGGSRETQVATEAKQNDVSKYAPQGISELRSRLLAKYTDITVSIDGVFFDDGTFIGPDTFGFFERMKAQVDAKQDLRNGIVEGIKEKKPQEEIFREIQAKADIEVKRPSDEGTTDYYNYCTKLFARQLLLMKKVYGNKVMVDILRLANKPQVTLRRAE